MGHSGNGLGYRPDPAALAGPEKAQSRRGSTRLWTERVYAERRRRDALFPEGIFGEPAWDLLLALFTAHETGETMILCEAYRVAHVSDTTGRRLLDQLEKEGLISRRRAPDSRKTRLVELTPDAVERMTEFWPR
jgi:DNA-binding MarR family transcriptional regulator